MPCRTVLGKVPLVLKPFTNCTIDESPETVAKELPIAENKLSLIHCLRPNCPAGIHDQKLSTYASGLPILDVHKSIGFTPAFGCSSEPEQRSLNSANDQILAE
jgi:hypothetical protein